MHINYPVIIDRSYAADGIMYLISAFSVFLPNIKLILLKVDHKPVSNASSLDALSWINSINASAIGERQVERSYVM